MPAFINGFIKAICVDEAQDLNRVQYEVIKAIGGNHLYIMVGDPNQAIYGLWLVK